MRRLPLVLAFLLVMALGFTIPAAAQEDPPGDIGNVDYITTVDSGGAISISFLTYTEGRTTTEVMVVSTRDGVLTYNIDNPTNAVFLDQITAEELKLPTDTEDGRGFWQNEDMNVDQDRKVIYMARDPRAYTGSTNNPNSIAGVYVVDAADPSDLQLREFVELPTGHTTTCINSCDYLWTGGPASNTDQQAEWPGGRPIFVTDVRDLDNIVTSPDPIDTGRNDGVTDYAHDVQVDRDGIAWVSGRGGVRGYHTEGAHVDPTTGVKRLATAVDPIPYAGGKFSELDVPSSFMHNSVRPTHNRQNLPPEGFENGELILATEEAFGSSTCDGIGVFVIASLAGSYDGEGWASTPDDPFRLDTVGTWNPTDQEGTILNSFCSAHYFEVNKNIVAYSWYAQGTRFLDISDPTDPIQVGYFRPDGGSSYAPYFHGNYVYVADSSLGVHIVKLDRSAYRAAGEHRAVTAPTMSAAQVAYVNEMTKLYEPDPDLGWACPIPLA